MTISSRPINQAIAMYRAILALPSLGKNFRPIHSVLSLFLASALAVAIPNEASAQDAAASNLDKVEVNQKNLDPETGYTTDEVIQAGHKFFGTVSGGLASVVETAFSRFGLPNGYILGEQASGAFFGGLQYGEGILYTKTAGQYKAYWQGPTIGWDFGGEGTRSMMLVYNLPKVEDLYKRFPGVRGTAVVVGGVGMSVRKRGDIVIVPIQSGVGARLGVNVGYIKFTTKPKINPF
ncbi:MAG: EipA family protein [Pseudomonadota bacterium]